RVARALRRAGLPAPVRQYQVVAGRHVFLVDLAWPDHRVGVEVDGFEAHATRLAFDHDRERGVRLAWLGWRIIHATSRTDLALLSRTLRRLFRGQKGA
ncbi:MAG: hypothetical protein ACRD0D_12610, partial [Acidimicrobiales bacterium]